MKRIINYIRGEPIVFIGLLAELIVWGAAAAGQNLDPDSVAELIERSLPLLGALLGRQFVTPVSRK